MESSATTKAKKTATAGVDKRRSCEASWFAVAEAGVFNLVSEGKLSRLLQRSLSQMLNQRSHP